MNDRHEKKFIAWDNGRTVYPVHGSAMSGRKGFTLIELLTVIGIISLLLSVLAPSLMKARDASRSVVCLGNLRQMAVAAENYVLSHQGYYPLAMSEKQYETVGDLKVQRRWDFFYFQDESALHQREWFEPGYLWQGDTVERIQQCPAYKGASNHLNSPFSGYNYNTSHIGFDGRFNPPRTAKAMQVHQPGQTVLFGDGGTTSEGPDNENRFMRGPFYTPDEGPFVGRQSCLQSYRHLKKTNVSFCDGHAEHHKEIYVNTDPISQEKILRFNEKHPESPVGFLSEDNRLYDLK
jgi:prepilin-type N-terminal cleavage/methylation domain-containing protein/prepilin-type processing-associated H-X9-DG protein